MYLKTDQEPSNIKNLALHQELALQICRNRWTEGIYDIPIESIESNQVTVSQNIVPDLAEPNSFNDLQSAWTKARKELLSSLPEDNIFRNLGYDLIVEFMKPNLLFDRETTERRQRQSLDKVPRSQGVVLKDELIVDANIRITDDVLQKLNSLSVAVTKKNQGSGITKVILNYIGMIILFFKNKL